MTDFSQGPMHPIWVDVVAAVRTLMEQFSKDAPEEVRRSGAIREGFSKLETHDRPAVTYALVAFAAATVSWAAHEVERDVFDVLTDIARGVGVDLE
jgi:hypothetical protein